MLEFPALSMPIILLYLLPGVTTRLSLTWVKIFWYRGNLPCNPRPLYLPILLKSNLYNQFDRSRRIWHVLYLGKFYSAIVKIYTAVSLPFLKNDKTITAIDKFSFVFIVDFALYSCV